MCVCLCVCETCERRVEISVSCVQLVGIQLNYKCQLAASLLDTQEELVESRCWEMQTEARFITAAVMLIKTRQTFPVEKGISFPFCEWEK